MKGDDWSFIGLDSGVRVRPGQVVTMAATVQRPFQPRRVVAWSRGSSEFALLGMHVGTFAVGVGAGVLPMDAFNTDWDATALVELSASVPGSQYARVVRIAGPSVEWVGVAVKMEWMSPGMQLRMDVEHIGAEPRRFMCGILGTLEDRPAEPPYISPRTRARFGHR